MKENKDTKLTTPKVSNSKIGNSIRCSICGKFISYNDVDNGKAEVNFTPDTEYTIECTEFIHSDCLNK